MNVQIEGGRKWSDSESGWKGRNLRFKSTLKIIRVEKQGLHRVGQSQSLVVTLQTSINVVL